MAKPTIKPINTFDASNGTIVYFVWNGNAAYNNRLVIYDAETLNVVYDDTYASNYYKLQHEIPSNTLSNGKKYAAEIYVLDRNKTSSDPSDKYYFWTNTTPQFYFDGLNKSSANRVSNSSYQVSLKYTQVDDVTLASYQFFLYSSAKMLLDSSSVYKNTRYMDYTYRSLENMATYYIRATGITSRNMEVDTGYIQLVVNYEEPEQYAQLYTDVNTTIGTVDYHTNITQVEADREGNQYTFIDDGDGWIDLTQVNPNRTCAISAVGNVSPKLYTRFTHIDGSEDYITAEGNILVSDYSEIREVAVMGNYYQPALGTSYTYLTDCNLKIDGKKVPDVLDGKALLATPSTSDMLYIYSTGRRTLHHYCGESYIDGDYEGYIYSVPHHETGGAWVDYGYSFYFDLGISVNASAENMLCNTLVVEDTDDYKNKLSFVRIAKYRGKMQLELYLSISLLDQVPHPSDVMPIYSNLVREWLNLNPFSVVYPIDVTTELLSPANIPTFKNVDSVRFSKNLTIPFENATFSVRIRNAYRTGEILRAHSGDDVSFILESFVYDDKTVRFKLTADDMVIYSDGIYFRSWDIITIHIRRINGLYGLYVFVQDEARDQPSNMWFIDSEPDDSSQETDIWLNKDYPTTYINKDTVVRFYQSTEPSGAADQNIWIGDL